MTAHDLVDATLAPFVVVGTITSVCSALMGFAAKVEADQVGMSEEDGRAYVSAMVDQGVALGGAIALWPVALLVAEAIAGSS